MAQVAPPPEAIVVSGGWQIEGLQDIVRRAGPEAAERTVEFFTAQIRNPHTRAAYGVAVTRFFTWCDARGLELAQLSPIAVSTYIEEMQRGYRAPTIKQHLAAIRRLFDWLVTGQVMPTNPATSVRGPTHVVRTGKTPVLQPAEARQLLDAIDTATLRGLRVILEGALALHKAVRALHTGPARVFWPSAAIPRATTRPCSTMCTPSRSTATRSNSSSGADCHVRSCTVVFAPTRRRTLLWLVPRLTTPAGRGSRLRAYWRVATPHQHVLDDAPIQRVGVRQGLDRRPRDLTPVGADPRPRDSHLAPAQHDFAGHRARAGRGTRGRMRRPRTAQRRAILLQHRVEHAEARADHQLEAFGLRVDQACNER